ncbi:protein of unknown function [Mesotoga infera]|uniref:Uncharacterized protein n=1 Tax=Mesotoga infera TaxID=1236046 RepID=A0A7Z7LDD7_9BACT|nr:protein of unknown function [Mesotoga infera]
METHKSKMVGTILFKSMFLPNNTKRLIHAPIKY